MVAARVLALAAIIAALAACSGSHKNTNGVSGRDAVIRIDAKVVTATIVINGRELGTVENLQRGIALSPGTHRLEVQHPDYHTHYQLLELTKRERRVVSVELAERLP